MTRETTQPRASAFDRLVDRLVDRTATLRLPAVAALPVVIIVAFGVLGWNFIDHSRVFKGGGWDGSVVIGGHHISGFNLDGERNLPTAWSGLLLVAASALGFVAVRLSRETAIPTVLLAPVAGLFAFMSLDEVWTIHERFETATGVPWQVFYIPVFAAAGFAALRLVPHLRRFPPAAPLLVVGGVVWFVAQMIDKWQWNADDVLVHPYSIVPEETMEMLGSLLFLLTMLTIIRTVARHRRTENHCRALTTR
jgi:hypothetical protein